MERREEEKRNLEQRIEKTIRMIGCINTDSIKTINYLQEKLKKDSEKYKSKYGEYYQNGTY